MYLLDKLRKKAMTYSTFFLIFKIAFMRNQRARDQEITQWYFCNTPVCNMKPENSKYLDLEKEENI